MNIRNFCIISHVDHGKSTLADRMLELTGTIQKRDMKEQLLDQLDLERERGITIKLAPVRMQWRPNFKGQILNFKSNPNDQFQKEAEVRDPFKIENLKLKIPDSMFTLNLIDTPGHVDFAYEVSRSLAAVEGAVLLVDASQGIEAQTLSVLYAAMDHDLVIIPVVNKIDLPAARPDEVADEIVKVLGCSKDEILYASGKTGIGVAGILDAIIERIPAPNHQWTTDLQTTDDRQHATTPVTPASLPSVIPTNAEESLSTPSPLRGEGRGEGNAPLRALIFDSVYDPYRGVVSYIRVFEGQIARGDKFILMETQSEGEALEVGYFSPKLTAQSPLAAGQIGYIITGFKDVSEARVGDTVTLKTNPADASLPGYKKVLPLVFSSIFCADGSDYPELKEAIEKLKLNDASLTYEVEQSDALGFGFRCGFLGLLHMDIVKERLEREHNLSLVVSSPTVQYRVVPTGNFKDQILNSKSNLNEQNINLSIENSFKIENLKLKIPEIYIISRPSDFPVVGTYQEILEPVVALEVFSPKEYVGSLMEVIQRKRAIFETMEYLDESRVILRYKIPLAEVIIDLYDQIKSVSKGYASMNYEIKGYESADLEKVDILIAEEKVDALSFITHKLNTYAEGKRIVERLKELIPRQNFEVKLQAAIGGKIIASERISPFKKDVIAKLYGGDVTRKNKLLEKQKKGKKKMKQIGRVEVPSDVFIKVLRNE